jgi:hypothetical protein
MFLSKLFGGPMMLILVIVAVIVYLQMANAIAARYWWMFPR